MHSWQSYLLQTKAKKFYVNPSSGYHGISYVRNAICNVIEKTNTIDLINQYKRDAHVVLVNIDFKHFLLRRHINTYIFHDAIMYKYLPKWKQIILKYVQQQLIKRADKVVCISYYAQSELHEYHELSLAKSLVIYNELNDYALKEYVVWVGSDKSHKGRAEVIMCASALDIDFILIGVDPEKGDSINVTCVKNLPDIIYDHVLNNSIALVVTSKEEGFHLPTAEALKLGKKVFALKLPVLGEIYGEKILQFKNIKELTRSLKAYVASCK